MTTAPNDVDSNTVLLSNQMESLAVDTSATETKNGTGTESSSKVDDPSTELDGTSSTANDASSQQQQQQQDGDKEEDEISTTTTVSRDELTELVRAIRFSMPDASQRQVYKEITEVISVKDNGRYSFLKDAVVFNDVKKVWKKASQQQQQQQQQEETASNNQNADLVDKLKSKGVVPVLFTVGNDLEKTGIHPETETMPPISPLQALAQDLVSSFKADQSVKESQQALELSQDYVHVYLDVPMDRSGSRPHQALINFQSTKAAGGGGGNKKKGKKKQTSNKKNNKTQSSTSAGISPSSTSNSSTEPLPFDDAIIVKIQRAAPLNDSDTTKHPMLLYDQTRTSKTCIHYENSSSSSSNNDGDDGNTNNDGDDDKNDRKGDVGYDKIVEWMETSAVRGALGASGGTKAYFYGRLTKTKKGPNIMSIYIKDVAPVQPW